MTHVQGALCVLTAWWQPVSRYPAASIVNSNSHTRTHTLFGGPSSHSVPTNRLLRMASARRTLLMTAWSYQVAFPSWLSAFPLPLRGWLFLAWSGNKTQLWTSTLGLHWDWGDLSMPTIFGVQFPGGVVELEASVTTSRIFFFGISITVSSEPLADN